MDLFTPKKGRTKAKARSSTFTFSSKLTPTSSSSTFNSYKSKPNNTIIDQTKIMFSGNADPPQKSLTTKQADENKFFSNSKHLSKESSIANPSLRVYYGGLPANVPFMWESQPGTPKYTFSEDTVLPPLTPPPSYFSNSYKKPTKKHSRSNLLHTLFLKLSLKKTHVASSPSSPSSPSSSLFSSSSDSSVNTRNYHGRSRFSSTSSSFDSMGDYEQEDVGSPTSILCFRFSTVSTGGNRGCHGF